MLKQKLKEIVKQYGVFRIKSILIELDDEERLIKTQDIKIKDVEFSNRIKSVLSKFRVYINPEKGFQDKGLIYLNELAMLTEKELLRTENLGWASVNEIKEVLKEYGLELRYYK